METMRLGLVGALFGLLAACDSGGSSSPAAPVDEKPGADASSSSASNSSSSDTSSSSASSIAKTSSASSSSSSVSSASSSSLTSSSPGSSSSSSIAIGAGASVGVLTNSPVSGIRYETSPGGYEGFTNSRGQFLYAAGDFVTFNVGDLEFPSVLADSVITPLDLGETDDPTHGTALNIAALLQSLDVDGNPNNGIMIDYEAAAAVAEPLEFSHLYDTFAALPEVITLVENAGSVTTELVSASDALRHLQISLSDLDSALLPGAWVLSNLNRDEKIDYTLFILDDQNYASVDTAGADAVLETGTYSWDFPSGSLSVNPTFSNRTTMVETQPMADGNVLRLRGDMLSIESSEGSYYLDRLEPGADQPLVGGWHVSNDETLAVVAFTGDLYFMGQYSLANDGGMPGAEVGSYTYSPETLRATFNPSADSNGQWGFSHPCAVLDLQQPGDLSCGAEGADVEQTLEVKDDVLIYVSEADTIAEGAVKPVTFTRVR